MPQLMEKQKEQYTILGKVVSKKVWNLQKLYEEQGPTSKEFIKHINNLIIYGLKKKCYQFSEELLQHTYDRVFDRIVPKLDDDGQYRCFYIQKNNGKKMQGYDKNTANIGNYILSVVNWSYVHYQYHFEKNNAQLLYNEELENYDKLAYYDNDCDYNFKIIDLQKSDIDDNLLKLIMWVSKNHE